MNLKMRNKLLRLFAFIQIFVLLPLLFGCALIDRLEAVGAGYEEIDGKIYAVPLNAAARRLYDAINSGDAESVSALIYGADADSARRLTELFGKISGYRISRYAYDRLAAGLAEYDRLARLHGDSVDEHLAYLAQYMYCVVFSTRA